MNAQAPSVGMHNPQGSLVLRPFLSVTILEHALEVAALCRPLIAAIQRRDRDLASRAESQGSPQYTPAWSGNFA